MNGWKLVVWGMVPPPLALTALLVIPMPRVVSRGLLVFARSVLFCPVLGGILLVHLMLAITAAMLIGAGVHTHQLRHAIEPDLTPNQRTAVMARIWREERNFWISVLTFLLWGLLYRFYSLMMEHHDLKDRVKSLEAELRGARTGTPGVPPPKLVEPSAPPLPSGDSEGGARLRGRSKAA